MNQSEISFDIRKFSLAPTTEIRTQVPRNFYFSTAITLFHRFNSTTLLIADFDARLYKYVLQEIILDLFCYIVYWTRGALRAPVPHLASKKSHDIFQLIDFSATHSHNGSLYEAQRPMPRCAFQELSCFSNLSPLNGHNNRPPATLFS